MRTKLTVVTAMAGTLLATCLVSGSAQATSVPVLRGAATPGIVTLAGRGGGACRCRASTMAVSVSGVTMVVSVSGVTMAESVSGVTVSVSGVTVSVLGVTMADATALAHITIGMAWLASTPAGTRT